MSGPAMGAEITATGLILFCALTTAACGDAVDTPRTRMTPEYDQAPGKLTLLKYDSDGNGTVDTWSYMDGSRVVRVEIDKNEDGKIDRWEYYDADQKLQRIGTSRAQDGKEDSWSYPANDGSITRIDVSTNHDGKITRVEHYEKGVLTALEEDTD